MPVDNATLVTELTTDPLGRGYSGMTDQQAADDLNTAYRSRNRSSVKGSEIFNAIVLSEYDALADAEKLKVQIICGLGDDIDVGAGTNTRAFLIAAFGPATVTRDNLIALASESISRAIELGLSELEAKHVRIART